MPEKQITYTQKFTVYRADGDHLGNVKLGALLRYAQQIATTHAEAVGLNDSLYRETHTAYVLAKLALHVTPSAPRGRGADPRYPARALQTRRQQAHHPFLRCRAGQRSPQWTAAGCSSTPKSG